MITGFALMLLPPLFFGVLQQQPVRRPVAEAKTETRRISAAARQNPAIRAYFRERYGNAPLPDLGQVAREDRSDFQEKAIDSLIDANTEKVWKLADELHGERDKLWSAMTPGMIDILRNHDPRVRNRASEPGIDGSMQELRSRLRKIERLAADMDSELAFIRFTLAVTLSYRLGKLEGTPGENIREDIESVARSVAGLQDALFEFYYPMRGAVSVDALTNESIPYILEKIRKTAERACDSLVGR